MTVYAPHDSIVSMQVNHHSNAWISRSVITVYNAWVYYHNTQQVYHQSMYLASRSIITTVMSVGKCIWHIPHHMTVYSASHHSDYACGIFCTCAWLCMVYHDWKVVTHTVSDSVLGIEWEGREAETTEGRVD